MSDFAKFWWGVLAYIVVACASVGLAVYSASTLASDWNDRICQYVARDAGVLHDAKQEGMAWTEAEPALRQLLTQAMNNPDSYIKDEADVERSITVGRFVWTHDLSKADTMEAVQAVCRGNWRGVGI